MLALLAVGFLSACEPVTLGGLGGAKKPTVSAPPPSSEQAPPSPSSAPQVASVPDPTGPRPPNLPSLEDLLGRAPGTGMNLSEPPPLPPARGTRVAILLPLTGPNQRIGHALLSASELALFDFAGSDFEILVRDTGGTPEGAAEAARIAIGDGARLILGPLLSGSVSAVADQARAANVSVLAFSSDRRVAGDGVYTMGFFPGDEVRRVVAYAHRSGARRFALLAPQDAYGDMVEAALQDVVFALGAEFVRVERYNPLAVDFSDPVRRIAAYDGRRQALLDYRAELSALDDDGARAGLKRLEGLQTIGDPPFDALLLADGGKRLIAVAAMLPFYDIDPKAVSILGTGQWDVPGLGAEPALVGGWFAAPDPNARKDFARRYLEVYGARPHRLATLAYDATALAVVLGNSPGPLAYGSAALTQPTGFAGRDGIFRFQDNGEAERGLAVLKVEPRDTQVIERAPTSFP